jgi:hypothetical protein
LPWKSGSKYPGGFPKIRYNTDSAGILIVMLDAFSVLSLNPVSCAKFILPEPCKYITLDALYAVTPLEITIGDDEESDEEYITVCILTLHNV